LRTVPYAQFINIKLTGMLVIKILECGFDYVREPLRDIIPNVVKKVCIVNTLLIVIVKAITYGSELLCGQKHADFIQKQIKIVKR
jgi:hypothetical protein